MQREYGNEPPPPFWKYGGINSQLGLEFWDFEKDIFFIPNIITRSLSRRLDPHKKKWILSTTRLM